MIEKNSTIQLRFVLLLSATVFLLFSGRQSIADTHLGPILTFEQFHRSNPDNAEVIRWGGGLRLTTDLTASLLAFEAETVYSSENDTFSTGNTYEEQVYRGRSGLLFRVLTAGPLYFGLRVGAQFDLIFQDLHIPSSKTTQSQDLKFLTYYYGGEVALLPSSGFGIQMGVTTYYDKSMPKWIPQFFVGLVLK